MAMYTHRVQAVLSDEQYATLDRIARETGRPVSLLIRDAVEQVYVQQAQQGRRQAALAELVALNAPVADWEQMEDEIAEGAAACLP